MWCDHPFSHQRYRATQRTVRVKVVGDREVGQGGGGQNLKKGIGNIGDIHKIRELAPFC